MTIKKDHGELPRVKFVKSRVHHVANVSKEKVEEMREDLGLAKFIPAFTVIQKHKEAVASIKLAARLMKDDKAI